MVYFLLRKLNFKQRTVTMTRLYEKIKEYILRDMEKEGESNDLAVLLRVLSIIGILHYFVMVFPVASIGNIMMTLFLTFSIGILLGVLICTYENRTMYGLWLYNAISLLFSVLMSLFIGWGYFFAPIVFVTVLLVFFSIKLSIRKKILYTVFCAVLVLLLAIGYNFMPLQTTPGLLIRIVLLAINISLSFFSLTAIAYAFCYKYTKSEEKIIQYNKRLEQLVNTDTLTTLWNRRAMNEHLATLVNNYNKYQTDFSLAILDIDFFKKVNDEYGHGMGDFVLKSLSYLLKTFMDGKGHVARWGGEEFLLTFEDMDYDQAIGFMEELRVRIEDQDFTFKDVNLHLTITAGIEEYHSGIDLDQTLTKADEKLYTGKTSGRNQVVSSYYSM
ncbi:MAG: diguanylate cyclase [Lachnospiraceae bacterium]|nr:diguanylate cyclase [Lachnospiraceae bacterium]